MNITISQPSISNYERTQYPSIFKKTYWGTFRHIPNSSQDISQSIFDNRNRFVKDYKIRRVHRRFRKYKECNTFYQHKKYYDHVEFYETIDKQIVMVVSPYNSLSDIQDDLINDGFTISYKLYVDFATTAIKYLDFENEEWSQKKCRNHSIQLSL